MLHDGLSTALAEHLVDSVVAPPNYSVRLGDGTGQFHFLYWGGTTVVRTLDPARLLRGLFDHLSSHGGTPEAALPVEAFVIVRGGVALLAPLALRGDARLQSMLLRHGFAVVDTPWAEVDLDRAELVIREPALSLDRRAVDSILAAAPCARREPETGHGTVPIAAWVMAGKRSSGNLRLSRAEATIGAIGMLPTPISPATLRALGRFFGKVPGHSISVGEPPRAIVDALDEMTGSD